jgi:hypothetical protein
VSGREKLIEEVTEPGLEHVDLGFGDRHLVGPVVGDRPCGRILRRRPAGRRDGLAGARSRRGRRAIRPPSRYCVFGICVCEPCSESRTRPGPKQWPKHTQHHTAARPSQSRLERVRSHHSLPAWTALAGPVTACQARKPAEPGAPTARGLTGWRGPGPLVKSRPTTSGCPRLVHCRGYERNAIANRPDSRSKSVQEMHQRRRHETCWRWEY